MSVPLAQEEEVELLIGMSAPVDSSSVKKETRPIDENVEDGDQGRTSPVHTDVEKAADESASNDRNVDGHEHRFNEQTNYVPKSTIITIFLACASVDFLALMDQTTLAAALTIVSNALDAGGEQAWIAGAYFVTSTCFQLLYGRLSDIWSRKVILLVGLGIFFVGSLGASLSQTSIQLIAFRALTGAAGGGLVSVAQMIVSDVVPLRERGKYQGILVSLAGPPATQHCYNIFRAPW